MYRFHSFIGRQGGGRKAGSLRNRSALIPINLAYIYSSFPYFYSSKNPRFELGLRATKRNSRRWEIEFDSVFFMVRVAISGAALFILLLARSLLKCQDKQSDVYWRQETEDILILNKYTLQCKRLVFK